MDSDISDAPVTPVDISIIVTTYDHEKSVHRCIESIVTQDTGYTFEILVGDDGSSDRTLDVLQHCAATAPHLIRLFGSKRLANTYRLGYPTARAIHSELIRNARGRYLTFIDGDDFYTDPRKLDIQVSFLDDNTDYVASCHDTGIWRGKKMLKRHLANKQRDNEIDFEAIASGDKYFFLPSFVYRRTFPSGEVPQRFSEPYFTDYGIALYFLEHGKCRYIDRPMTAYNLTGEGVWSSLSVLEKYRSRLWIREDLMELYSGDKREAIWVGWYRNLLEYRNQAIRVYWRTKNPFGVVNISLTTLKLWLRWPRYAAFARRYRKRYEDRSALRTARRTKLFERQ